MHKFYAHTLYNLIEQGLQELFSKYQVHINSIFSQQVIQHKWIKYIIMDFPLLTTFYYHLE